ncbi:MAG: hypothetical protein V4685_06010 [Bacteroidota bacterium]
MNTADMHRVRQSVPYFKQLGWEPVVITVDEAYAEAYSRDTLLLHTVPEDIEVHKVKALPAKYTRKVGLGSLSIRAYWHIRKKGNELLRKNKFHLVYFSTTAFHVMALGPEWKKKFKVPFILDIQDPWRNDFYLSKPAAERPPKFFIAYTIDKYLESKTVPYADGIISVSKAYCDTFLQRYPSLIKKQCKVITFGAADKDISVMKEFVHSSANVSLPADKINAVYVGRGGHDMSFAAEIIFTAFAKGLRESPDTFSKMHFWFIGTSYAAKGMGKQTIYPVAEKNNVAKYVTEITDRIPYFESLFLLDKAQLLIVPGSTDTAYTASKIYPYIMLNKKMLAVFNFNSSVVSMLQELNYGELVAFDHQQKKTADYVDECYEKIVRLLKTTETVNYNKTAFEPYMALSKTKEQVDFFNEVVSK